MQKMHVNFAKTIYLNFNLVIGKLVYLSFVFAPVKFVAPMVDKAFDIRPEIVSLTLFNHFAF